MNASSFRRVIAIACFEGKYQTLSATLRNMWWEWIEDAAGKQRVNPQDWTIVDINVQNKEVSIQVDGEDSHDGSRRRVVIYSNFSGKVREVEPYGDW